MTPDRNVDLQIKGTGNANCMGKYIGFFFFLLLKKKFFFWLRLWHVEVPGIEPMRQFATCATAVAMSVS